MQLIKRLSFIIFIAGALGVQQLTDEEFGPLATLISQVEQPLRKGSAGDAHHLALGFKKDGDDYVALTFDYHAFIEQVLRNDVASQKAQIAACLANVLAEIKNRHPTLTRLLEPGHFSYDHDPRQCYENSAMDPDNLKRLVSGDLGQNTRNYREAFQNSPYMNPRVIPDAFLYHESSYRRFYLQKYSSPQKIGKLVDLQKTDFRQRLEFYQELVNDFMSSRDTRMATCVYEQNPKDKSRGEFFWVVTLYSGKSAKLKADCNSFLREITPPEIQVSSFTQRASETERDLVADLTYNFGLGQEYWNTKANVYTAAAIILALESGERFTGTGFDLDDFLQMEERYGNADNKIYDAVSALFESNFKKRHPGKDAKSNTYYLYRTFMTLLGNSLRLLPGHRNFADQLKGELLQLVVLADKVNTNYMAGGKGKKTKILEGYNIVTDNENFTGYELLYKKIMTKMQEYLQQKMRQPGLQEKDVPQQRQSATHEVLLDEESELSPSHQVLDQAQVQRQNSFTDPSLNQRANGYNDQYFYDDQYNQEYVADQRYDQGATHQYDQEYVADQRYDQGTTHQYNEYDPRAIDYQEVDPSQRRGSQNFI